MDGIENPNKRQRVESSSSNSSVNNNGSNVGNNNNNLNDMNDIDTNVDDNLINANAIRTIIEQQKANITQLLADKIDIQGNIVDEKGLNVHAEIQLLHADEYQFLANRGWKYLYKESSPCKSSFNNSSTNCSANARVAVAAPESIRRSTSSFPFSS